MSKEIQNAPGLMWSKALPARVSGTHCIKEATWVQLWSSWRAGWETSSSSLTACIQCIKALLAELKGLGHGDMAYT